MELETYLCLELPFPFQTRAVSHSWNRGCGWLIVIGGRWAAVCGSCVLSPSRCCCFDDSWTWVGRVEVVLDTKIERERMKDRHLLMR